MLGKNFISKISKAWKKMSKDTGEKERIQSIFEHLKPFSWCELDLCIF